MITRDAKSASAFLGLSLPLPLFDRNRGAIARAAAEVQADTLALEAEMAEARAEIERSRATLIARRQALGMVEGEILQRVPTLRRMAEDAYREGQGGTLELLDASRSLKDIQLVHVRQLESFRLGGHSRRRRGTGYHANSVGQPPVRLAAGGLRDSATSATRIG